MDLPFFKTEDKMGATMARRRAEATKKQAPKKVETKVTQEEKPQVKLEPKKIKSK